MASMHFRAKNKITIVIEKMSSLLLKLLLCG